MADNEKASSESPKTWQEIFAALDSVEWSEDFLTDRNPCPSPEREF